MRKLSVTAMDSYRVFCCLLICLVDMSLKVLNKNTDLL